jgi:hypothetical protein
MIHHTTAILAMLLAILLTGCTSIHKHTAYREAGSPIDNRSTILIGYHLDSVKIDGEDVSLLGQGWGTAAWIVEMLPGLHKVEGIWGGRKFSGSFEAKNGKDYTLMTDTSSVVRGDIKVRALHQVYIAELPSGESHSLSLEQRMGFTQTKADEAKKEYKKVADLHIVENDN